MTFYCILAKTKSMKSFLTFFFAVCLFAIASAQVTSTEAHLNITGNTTREELGVMAQSCHNNGFDFRYQPQFDAQRRLTGIRYTLTTADKSVKGEGEHMKLQAVGASITIHLNKTKGTFTEDAKGK